MTSKLSAIVIVPLDEPVVMSSSFKILDKDHTNKANHCPRCGALPHPQPIMILEAHHAHQSDVESGPNHP